MAIRQYIGARYVPKLVGEWQANTFYEALSIVTSNNVSYTSKKPVPATVGTPAENPEYWVATGNYSAQMNELIQEVNGLSGTVSNLSGEVDGIEGDIAAIRTSIADIPTSLREKNLFVVGDSWAVGFTDNTGQGFVEELSDRNIFKSVHKYAAGGIGYTTETSLLTKLQELEAAYADRLDEVNIIIIQGGVNDYTKSTSLIQSGASATFAYARSHFPNAEIYAIANITSTRNGTYYEKSELPLKIASENGCIPLYWPHRMLFGHETQFTEDKFHLKHVACVFYANNIINNILGHFAFDPDGNTIATTLGSSPMTDFYSAAQQINFEGRYADLLIVATSGKRNSDHDVPLFTFTNDYLPSIEIHGANSITKPKFVVIKDVVSGSNIKHNNNEFQLDNNGNVINIYDAADLTSNLSMGDMRFRFDRLARAFV